LPCNKIKPIHITDINSDKVETKTLCKDCAVNFISEQPQKAILPNLSTALGEFLTFIEKEKPVQVTKMKTCPSCGMTIKQFSETARLGCLDCYDFFGKELSRVIKLCQVGAIKHAGKIPTQFKNKLREDSRRKLLRSVASLIVHHQIQLKAYTAYEKYEEAAMVRDKIIDLQKLSSTEKKLQEELLVEENEEMVQKLEWELQELLDQAMNISNR